MDRSRRPRALALVALALLGAATAARAQCPALTVDFFPEGSTNVPAGWTREAQEAAGNELTSSLNTITLTASPAPKLYVQPVHPLFSRRACVPADCLSSGASRRMLLAEEEAAAAATEISDAAVAAATDAAKGGAAAASSAAPAEAAAPPAAAAAAPADSTGKEEEEAQAQAPPQEPLPQQQQEQPQQQPQEQPQQQPQEPQQPQVEERVITEAEAAAFGGALNATAVSGLSPAQRLRLAATCLTTVAAPAAYDITYNIDGGITKKATMPAKGSPFISLSTLDTLEPGKHTINIMVKMIKQSAEVNSVASMQPPSDQLLTTKVAFNLVDKAPAEAEAEAKDGKAAAPPAAAAKAAASDDKKKPAAAAATDEGDAAAGAADKPKRPVPKKALDEVLPPPAPAVAPEVTQQAVKYQCMRQYNVGGRIHAEASVAAGDDGVQQCAVKCNALVAECAGFGLAGTKCFLMAAFATNSSAADATMDALCMKSANDWQEFGAKHAALVGGGFYCLRGYDVKGDPAGTGDVENVVQAPNTELQGMTPSTCATACRSTNGCQYMLIKRPLPGSGGATCYLKMHALGGLYGSTGPSSDVDFACFSGPDAWATFGSQLEYALPSPEVNTGVETPSVASISAVGLGPDAAKLKTYRCVKQYNASGAALRAVQVSLGDEGLTQCAGKCDAEPGCAAYSMAETGACTLLRSVEFNSSVASPHNYGLCFGSAADWNAFGRPDASGNYCLKNYDFAGDGVRTVDFITITSGAGGVQFCKQQCTAEPQCQYAVTSLGKCFMKNNILAGSFGLTRPDPSVDASCVKGEANWALAALQVSAAAPGGGAAGGAAGPGAANMTSRRTTMANAAGEAPRPFALLVLVMCGLMACRLGTMLGSAQATTYPTVASW